MKTRTIALATTLAFISSAALAQGSGASGDIGGSRTASPPASSMAPMQNEGVTQGSSGAPKKMTKAKTSKAKKGAEKE